MPNIIDCKPGAVDSVNAFSTSPSDKSEDDILEEVNVALSLARQAIIKAQKKALSFRIRYKNGGRREQRQVREDWNNNEAFRFLGPAPNKKKHFNAVYRRLRKLAERIRTTKVIVRPHTGAGSGSCSKNTNSLGYMSRLTAGGRLNVCPKFFLVREIEGDTARDREVQGAARQAGALTHELAHSLGLTGKGHKQVAGGRNDVIFREMRNWANANAKKARKNPSSYEAMITFIAAEL
jgi:hypothetical protein